MATQTQRNQTDASKQLVQLPSSSLHFPQAYGSTLSGGTFLASDSDSFAQPLDCGGISKLTWEQATS